MKWAWQFLPLRTLLVVSRLYWGRRGEGLELPRGHLSVWAVTGEGNQQRVQDFSVGACDHRQAGWEGHGIHSSLHRWRNPGPERVGDLQAVSGSEGWNWGEPCLGSGPHSLRLLCGQMDRDVPDEINVQKACH